MTRSRFRWRSVLAAASLLVLGAAIGVTVDRTLHAPSSRGIVSFTDVQADPLAVMDRLLDLRPEQRERIAAILESRQTSIDGVWEETHTRLQATIDIVVNEIAAALDPDQAERFRTLADELHGTGRVRHRQ